MSISIRPQQILYRFLRPGFSKQVRYASVLSTSSVPRTVDTTQLTNDTLPPQLRSLAKPQPPHKLVQPQPTKLQRPAITKAQNVTKAKNALSQIEEVLFMSQEILKTLKAQAERKELEHQLLTKQVEALREENRVTRKCLEKLLCKLDSIDTTSSQRQTPGLPKPKNRGEEQ